MFRKSTRIVCQQNYKTGSFEWCFETREGLIGPFQTKNQAKKTLGEFIRTCIRMGDDGGRDQGSQKLSLMPLPLHQSTRDERWII